MSNAVVHWEIGLNDVEKGREFYSKLFDWNITNVPEMGSYNMVNRGEGTGNAVGGGMYISPEGKSSVVFYIGVDDVQASLDLAVKHGAEVIVPPSPIPGIGGFAIFKDVSGNGIGIYSSNFPGVETQPHDPSQWPPAKGCPIQHFEIGVRNDQAAWDFYSKVFGWDIKVDENYRYGEVKPAGEFDIGGGIYQIGAEQHPYVTLYVTVSDLATYIKKAEELGGKLALEKQVIPGVGSVACFMDPEGNLLGLFSTEQ